MSYYDNALKRANLVKIAINYLPDGQAEIVITLSHNYKYI